MQQPVTVWDAPVRLFHWAIVVLVATSWLTRHEGWMSWHFYSGYAIGALLLGAVAEWGGGVVPAMWATAVLVAGSGLWIALAGGESHPPARRAA